jgi:hypothetical protein
MTLTHRPITGSEAHTQATDRLGDALDEQARRNQRRDAAEGTSDELTAAVGVAAANEQVAAREAWVKYIEHGY